MGFKSSDWASHRRSWNGCNFSRFCTLLLVYFGSLSCWYQIIMFDYKPQEVFQNKFAHMLIHYTFNFMPSSRSKSCHTTQIMICPPPCFTFCWTCCGCTCSPSVIQHQDLSSELNMFIFISTLKITHFQSWMVQFAYMWANLTHSWTCFLVNNGFFYCTCAAKPSHRKARLTITLNTFLPDSFQIFVATFDATPKCPSVSKVTHLHLSLVVRCLGCPPFCLSSSPDISFLSLTTQDWLIPIASATFRVELPFQSCSNAWSFCDTVEQGIQEQLHECSLLHNLHLQSVTMH